MKIGILTLPFDANYGYLLQQYALLNFLRKHGYDAYEIYRKWDRKSSRGIKYKVMKWVYYHILCRNLNHFYKNSITPKTVLIDSQDGMRKLSKYDFSAYVVGSDQVWRRENTGGVKDNYFLDFVEGDAKKIAYAASFGKDEWKSSVKDTKRITSLLKEFSLITVREDTAVELCHNIFDVKAHHVLDPTMLLQKEDYQKMFSSLNGSRKRYLASYILDVNSPKKELIRYVKKGIGVKGQRDLYQSGKYSIYKSVEYWLESLCNADYIVTDSFHGMVFSILFNKQFIVVANQKRGLTRFVSLLRLLDLESRLVFECTDWKAIDSIILNKIDYSKVNNTIVQLREMSTNLLFNALSRM